MPPKKKKRTSSGVGVVVASPPPSPEMDSSMQARAEAMRHNNTLLDLKPIHFPEDWGECISKGNVKPVGCFINFYILMFLMTKTK